MVIGDFVNMTYVEIARQLGDEAALKKITESGLVQHLAQAPSLYYKDEIINRRNEQMTKNTLAEFQSGRCSKGLLIVGAMHAFTNTSGGPHVYKNGRKSMNQRFKELQFPALGFDFMESSYTFGFPEGLSEGHRTTHYRSEARWQSRTPWPTTADNDATIIVRK